MILIIVAGIMAAFLGLGVAWGRRPAVHRTTVDELSKYLNALLRRGYDGGFLVIKEAGATGKQGRFIQFSKYIANPGTYGLECAFPKSSWSRSYFPMLQAALDGWGFTYRLERTGEVETAAFINVDLARRVEDAQRLAGFVLTDLFLLSPDAPLTVTFHNISTHDELIDR